MADVTQASRGNTPSLATPKFPVDDHTPAISSPLNPDAPAPIPRPTRPPPREQREKRDTLKKRESTKARGGTPDHHRGRKSSNAVPGVPSPMRYSIPEPKLSDYEVPRDVYFISHEPNTFLTPEGKHELKRPLDLAENKKGYRYTLCVADPFFRHKQFYRQTETQPYGPRMSFNDSDKSIHFSTSGHIITNEKGWRMSKANVCAREGTSYFEVKILRGVPRDGPVVPSGGETTPQPHIRAGWARREAPLDAPVGFDGYSYGITDIRIDTMYRSRPGRLFHPSATKPKSSSKASAASKNAKAIRAAESLPAPDDAFREGDVLGLELTLPPLALHRKVVTGMYNPAVDNFASANVPSSSTTGALEPAPDVIRDRIPVAYKGHMYFEAMDYVPTKPVEAYADRGLFNKVVPHPNHEDPALRSLPRSALRVYKNGVYLGTAFENLLAFLPPASQPSAAQGARLGFDDAMLGYFPAVAAFTGGVAEVNFGPDWWAPPERWEGPGVELASEGDVGAKGRELKGVGERFKEQIAEDVLWDIVDEADFFAQDGGYAAEEVGGGAKGASGGHARRVANLQEASE
ncbi:MAG: hypothetical protein M1821_000055 [Bathelium mastoideum]|nr:MAG: hypothetical protein M1821_000055 [Bathelium mastoideum]